MVIISFALIVDEKLKTPSLLIDILFFNISSYVFILKKRKGALNMQKLCGSKTIEKLLSILKENKLQKGIARYIEG